MAKWIDIGPATDYPEGCQLTASPDGQSVLILRREGQLYAIANHCPHAGMPLQDGDCRGQVLTCPFHGYAYNIGTGQNIDFPAYEQPVRTYPLRITADDRIEIGLDAPDAVQADAASPADDVHE